MKRSMLIYELILMILIIGLLGDSSIFAQKTRFGGGIFATVGTDSATTSRKVNFGSNITVDGTTTLNGTLRGNFSSSEEMIITADSDTFRVDMGTRANFLELLDEGIVILSVDSTGRLFVLPESAAPGISIYIGDGSDTWISGGGAASALEFGTLGIGRFKIYTNGNAGSPDENRYRLIENANPTATQPAFLPAGNDGDTGIGHAAADKLSLIAGAVEMIRLTEDTADTVTVNADVSAFNSSVEQMRIETDGGIKFPNLLQQTAAGLVVEYDTGTNEIFAETSTLRMKYNVEKANIDYSDLFNVDLKTWQDNESGRKEYGLVAEDVYEAFPDLVVLDSSGKPLGIKSTRLTMILFEEIKRLRQEINELKNSN